MRKDYNKITTSDIPLDASFAPSVAEKPKPKTTTKPKINAIGKSTANKVKQQTSKTSTKPKKPTEENKVSKTKITSKTADLSDLEKMNEENLKSFRFKSKRNKVVIVLLSIMLAISITVIAVYMVVSKLETNCNMYVHDGVNATFYVEGHEMDKFRTPADLQAGRTLMLDIKLKIKESGRFKISFTVQTYHKGVLMPNRGVFEHGALFDDGLDGYYYSSGIIEGNQTIHLCNGIVIDEMYESSLNANNFRLDFHVYFQRIP